MENREAVSLEFEFQQHKTKSKRRENELLDALEEKQKEINKLQRSLQTITVDVLNNSREEAKKMTRSLNESDSGCAKCEDSKRLLEENEKIMKAFEELNSSFNDLKVSLEKATSEAESAKLRADYLETENGHLKKEADQLRSLNSTAEELQEQVAALQVEKCKLESVKIEFEVMSKEIANKIAEKMRISQEVANLNAQKDNLSVECAKLQNDVTDKSCLKDSLEKLRSENDLLRAELQTIKSKLEAARSEYNDLMVENQHKSDNYEKLNNELLSLQTLLHTVQSDYHDIQLRYEQIQAECNKHEGTIGEIQSEYKSIQKKYQSLQREYEKLENDSVQSIADCDRVQNENENLETEIRELKTKVEEAQRKLLENDSLQLELESLKSEMNRLQGEYDRNLSIKRKSASPDKKETEKCLREENAKLKADLLDLQQRFNEMQSEYDDISTQLVDTFADYETLQGEVARLEAELEQNKNIEVVDRLTENFKTMQFKTEQLEAENSQLLKENVEWKKTIMSMSESMREKCDEREQLVAQLEQVKNDSLSCGAGDGSKEKLEQFLRLTDSFVEIEIPTFNGSNRRFKVTGPSSLRPGTRMTIGTINDIVRGTFNEMRGAIEFCISPVESSNGEIYDSLDVENTSTGGNSCDSLEAETKSSNIAQIRELLEEKSELFEKLRGLEQSLATLKVENEQLREAKQQLLESQQLIDQLNDDKLRLQTICDENTCKMSELNEIISRDNRKLIVDCEQLKETVESDCSGDCYLSKECYEELQRLHQEILERREGTEKNDSLQQLADFERELRTSLRSDTSVEDIDRIILQYSQFYEKLTTYEQKVASLEKLLSTAFLQLKEILHQGNRTNGFDSPSRCRCAELNIALQEKSRQLAEIEAAKTEKYEQDICSLLEQLKQQECKCQEVQIEIIELKTSLEEKTKESAEHLAKFEELNARYVKLQSEHEELHSETQRMLQQSEERYTLMQENLRELEAQVLSLKQEREQLQEQKESVETKYRELEEKTLDHQKKVESPGDSINSQKLAEEIQAIKQQLKDVEDEKERLQRDKENLEEECNRLKLNELQKFETEKKNLTDELEILKSSERSLHGELQRLVEENELAVRDKQKAERELQQVRTEFEHSKQDCVKKLLTENKSLKERLQKLEKADEEKSVLKTQLEAIQSAETALRAQLEKIRTEYDLNKNELKRLERECLQAKDDVRHWKRECEQQEEFVDKVEAECRQMAELKNQLEIEKTQLQENMETLKSSEKSLQDRLQLLDEAHEEAVKAKQKLNEECSRLRLQVEKTSFELSSKLKEIEEEKRHLQTKMEAVKAEYDEQSMKCASITRDLDEANAAKIDLQAALEEANTRTEEIEVKFRLELDALRTTKAKEIDDLKEKLFKAEEDFKTAINGVDSEKNKVISKLTESTSSLTAQNSELEAKLTQLEQQIEELREALTTERGLKATLEKDSSSKENIIGELTRKNNSLETKFSEMNSQIAELERELQETRRKLQAETNLKDVLEKANAERDDLIVNLTNNNNSLARRAKDLDEKLAILGNQFEESKRQHSAEVAKLNQLLTQANEMNLNQSSRIEDLTIKITDLQGEIEKTSKAVLERDSLQLKLDQLQSDFNTISTKHAKLELAKSSHDAEINAARAAVLENTVLTKQLNDVQSSLKEFEYKCTELTSANEALRSKNGELAMQLKCTSNLEMKCKQLSEEIDQLKKELERTRSMLKEEQSRTASELKSKELQFAEQISQLKTNIGNLQTEKRVVQVELENLEKFSSEKIGVLERQVQCLQKEMAGIISKTSISPRREKVDHLLGENHQLKVKNMSLMDKLDSCQKSQNEERKNRRLSTHDERRMQSFWETNRDVSTMTDPTTTDCSCVELDRKLTELKQRLLIRDSQVNTLNMELKNHPLKTETATLKKLLIEEESKQQQLRQEVKKYKHLLMNKSNEIRACSRCADHSKKIFVNSCTQTTKEASDDSEGYRKLSSKYEDLKMICRGRHARIKELEDALAGKENSDINLKSLPNQQYRQKYELLKKDFKIIQEKYEEAKVLCNKRYEEIKQLTSQLKANS